MYRVQPLSVPKNEANYAKAGTAIKAGKYGGAVKYPYCL